MATLQQIRNQVYNKIRETVGTGHFSDQTVINGYINEAIEWTAVFIEYQRDLVNVQVEQGVSDYVTPSDNLFIRTAYFGSAAIPGDIRPLGIIIEETLRELYPGWLDNTTTSLGKPRYLIVKNRTTITIHPRPNADESASGKKLWINYNYVPTALTSDAQVPDLPLPYHNLVQYYALHLCYITLQNPAMSAEMLKQYAEKIKLIKSQVTKETKEGMAFQYGDKSMTVSQNNFAKAQITKSANILAHIGTPSANQPADVPKMLGQNAFQGDFLNSDAFGFDSPDGTPFGINEFGGLRHFDAIIQPTINHA